jgi:hypothetical protein
LGHDHTDYLVASAAQERALTALGLVANESVVVVTTDEAAALVQARQDQLGATVIDLRTSAAGARGACGTAVDPADCY